MKLNIGDKEARYYCPVCRHTLTRWVARRSPFYLSFCERAGREVKMRRLKTRVSMLSTTRTK